MIIYFLLLILFSLGIYGLLSQRNLIKTVLSISLLHYSVNLFLVWGGWRASGVAPILKAGEDASGFLANTVDPLPQEMALISIILGFGILVLMIGFSLRLYHHYRTYDLSEIRKLRG